MWKVATEPMMRLAALGCWMQSPPRVSSLWARDTESASPRAQRRNRAAGGYQGSGLMLWGQPLGSSTAGASGRGGAGRGSQTAAPANLASITLPDRGLQGAGGAQLEQEYEEQTGFREAPPLRARRPVYCREEKRPLQLASVLSSHSGWN